MGPNEGVASGSRLVEGALPCLACLLLFPLHVFKEDGDIEGKEMCGFGGGAGKLTLETGKISSWHIIR